MGGPKPLLPLGITVVVILILGLALRHGDLLLLTIPLITFLVAGAWGGLAPGAVHLKAHRTVEERQVQSGGETAIHLEVINTGRGLGEVHLIEELPPGLAVVEGEASLVTSLAKGERAGLEYRVSAERGRFRLPHLKARIRDSLGFSLREEKLPCPGEVLFIPRFDELKEIAIAPRRTKVYSGMVKARLGGTGVEFFGTREYRQGDQFRWINWNASARLSRLFTTEFEQERVADVGMILDARARADTIISGESLFEWSVGAAASLARYFIKAGNRVGLLIYGRYLDWTFPGYGRWQLVKLMEALTRTEKGDKAVFEGLENIPRQLFPAGSQLVLISTLQEEDVQVLTQLRALYSVMVISPDPLEFELARLDRQNGPVELAWRIGRLRRELILARLREAGVRVVDWKTSQPLRGATAEALSRVQR